MKRIKKLIALGGIGLALGVLVYLGATKAIEPGAQETRVSTDSIHKVYELCEKLPLPESEMRLEESERVISQTDYTLLHRNLREYEKVFSKEALESMYSSLNYFKANDVYQLGYWIGKTNDYANDSKRQYWKVLITGTSDSNDYSQVVRLYTDEHGKIVECEVHSQAVEEKSEVR